MHCKGSRRVLVVRAEGKGGINRLFQSLLEASPEGNTEIELYDSRGMGSLDLLKLPLRLYRFWAQIRSTPLELVHINLASNGSTYRKFLFSLLCRYEGVPYLLHLHGGGYVAFYRKSGLIGRKVVKSLFDNARSVIVLGKHWADFVENEVGADPHKVVILPNAVKRLFFSERCTHDGKVTILFLGRLGVRKGVPELLDAFSGRKLRDNSDWRAVIAGDGDVELYKAKADEAGLAERVHFPGWVGSDQVQELLTASDVLVLPSRAENQPLSLLEGMGAGLAVVATPVGAVPEVIQDGENGLLVPVADANALEEALVRLVTSQELRLKLSQKAILDFEKKYDIAAYRDKLEAIYANIRETPSDIHKKA